MMTRNVNGVDVVLSAQEEADFLAQQTIDISRPPSAEQLRVAAFKADPTRANLVTLINGSTPAQINTWLTNNVTTLAQARNVLGQLIMLIGGNSVS